VGFLGDLVYFGPALSPGRAFALARAKLAKARLTRATAAALRRAEPDDVLFDRVGLPQTGDLRVEALRGSFKPLAAVSLPGDVASTDDVASADAARAGDALKRAEAVLSGRQMLFGREIELGWPPRWEWRWDGLPEAAPFAADRRSTWEAQRLQGLLPLARAAAAAEPPARAGANERFARTGANERFARAYIDGVLDFARHHPGPDGLAWESALEVGLRLVSLAQGLPRIAQSDAFEARHVEIVRMLDRHARWLAVDLSLDKVVRGNHLLGELAGLLAAGRLLPYARATWWRGLDVPALLEAEILAQFHADGVSVEQSLTYEKFVLEFLILVGALGAARGEPFRATARERLGAALAHLQACTAPDGALPRIGDCDSGRGADWGGSDPHMPGGFVDGARRVLGVPPPAANGPLLRHFPDGGHVVVRDGDSFLFLRGGPFGHGIPGPASHSHADLLAPVLYLEGEAVLVDPGVYGYAVGEALRDGMRGSAAHSAVSFDAAAGPIPAGTFRWRRIPPPARLTGEVTAEGVLVEGEVRRGPQGNPLLWHRSIHYNQLRRTWLILDRVSQTTSGPLDWAFRFAAGVRLEQTGAPGVYRVVLPSGRAWRLTLDPVGEIVVEEGWIAPAYGSMVTAPILRRRLGTPPPDARAQFAPLG
jgi:hypothetical protein